MEIGKLDEVTALRNHRAAAQALRKRAMSELIDLRLGNEPMDAFSVISAEPIRAAVREACDAYSIEIAQLTDREGRLFAKCNALTERCEALEKVVDLARELRKAEYNYHAAISWDDITAILSLGNKTREARAKLDAALAEKSNG